VKPAPRTAPLRREPATSDIHPPPTAGRPLDATRAGAWSGRLLAQHLLRPRFATNIAPRVASRAPGCSSATRGPSEKSLQVRKRPPWSVVKSPALPSISSSSSTSSLRDVVGGSPSSLRAMEREPSISKYCVVRGWWDVGGPSKRRADARASNGSWARRRRPVSGFGNARSASSTSGLRSNGVAELPRISPAPEEWPRASHDQWRIRCSPPATCALSRAAAVWLPAHPAPRYGCTRDGRPSPARPPGGPAPTPSSAGPRTVLVEGPRTATFRASHRCPTATSDGVSASPICSRNDRNASDLRVGVRDEDPATLPVHERACRRSRVHLVPWPGPGGPLGEDRVGRDDPLADLAGEAAFAASAPIRRLKPPSYSARSMSCALVRRGHARPQ